MTINRASQRLEQLPFVTDAGAAPTDKGKIPCFQVKLTGVHVMNDTNEARVRDRIRRQMAGEFNGRLVVESSKDVIDEGTEDELACFWVYAYGALETFEHGGMTYNVVEWNPDWGVQAVPAGHADPMRVEAERLNWEEIPLTPEDFD